jgi:SAM-dependent methyltransferase
MTELVNDYAPNSTGRALEIGCQWGLLLDSMSTLTDKRWWGADPVIDRHLSRGGWELVEGVADSLPFPDSAFDCVVLANVYEHIPPPRRDPSIREIFRVLVPGGVLVGQLPNPHFPIESHSKLPFMGWLPSAAQNWYWNLSPSRRGAGFYSVSISDLQRRAGAAGFNSMLARNFTYPPEAAPDRVRWLVRRLRRPLNVVPWAWQFVLQRPAATGP